MTKQRQKFKTAALACHAALRAGNLPSKGSFGKCMKAKLGGKKRKGRKGRK